MLRRTLTTLFGISAIIAATLTVAAAPAAAGPLAPIELLNQLSIAAPSAVPYDRDLFEEGIDADGDGCRTRQEVLIAESRVPITVSGTCSITAGDWLSWYDGTVVTNPSLLEMDHLVALAEAWRSGAFAWTNADRAAYANDLDFAGTLEMTLSSSNQSKSDKDPTSWLPPADDAQCRYATTWAQVKYRWRLTVDPAEAATLSALFAGPCVGAMTELPERAIAETPAPAGGANDLPAGVQRLAGTDRYATAVEISQQFNPGVAALYIATGTNYPDALSASAVAGARGVPLLLVPGSWVPDVVLNEVIRLQPQSIIIVGSTTVVSAAVEAQLDAVAPVRRVAGSDRYLTSQSLLQDAGLTGSTAYVASGFNFPDALSAAAAAAKYEGGVLLVPGTATAADPATLNTLAGVGASTIRIAGSAVAVSAGIEDSLRNRFGQVFRHGGSDRYETGLLINSAAFPTASTVFIADGTNYPDALAGGALAGALGAPMFIVPKTCVPPAVRARILSLQPSAIVLLGGTPALSNAVAELVECAPTPVPPKPEPPQPPTPPANPGDAVNCSNFSTWAAAQAWFNTYYPYYGDVAGLDGDNDRIACESLPGHP